MGLDEEGEEGGFVFFGEVLDLAGASAGYVDGVAGGEEFVVGLAEDFVAELEGAGLGFEDAGADGEEFVVASGMVVAAVDVRDDHVGVVFELHALVVEAEGAHEFDAADFEPDEEVGMVDNAHLIGFGVTHADGDVVMGEHVCSDRAALVCRKLAARENGWRPPVYSPQPRAYSYQLVVAQLALGIRGFFMIDLGAASFCTVFRRA